MRFAALHTIQKLSLLCANEESRKESGTQRVHRMRYLVSRLFAKLCEKIPQKPLNDRNDDDTDTNCEEKKSGKSTRQTSALVLYVRQNHHIFVLLSARPFLFSSLLFFFHMCLMLERPHIRWALRFRNLFVCHFCAGALCCLYFSLIFFFVDCINKNAIEYEYESWCRLPVPLPLPLSHPAPQLKLQNIAIQRRTNVVIIINCRVERFSSMLSQNF